MKKFLLLALFCFPLFAQEFSSSLKEVDKKEHSKELLKQANQLFESAASQCAGLNAGLFTKCKNFIESQAENEMYNAISPLKEKSREDAEAVSLGKINELKCISALRKKLESLNIAYSVADDCDKLKSLIP